MDGKRNEESAREAQAGLNAEAERSNSAPRAGASLRISDFNAVFDSLRAALTESVLKLGVREASIWGAGTNGRICACLLDGSDVKLNGFYDSSAPRTSLGFPVRPEPESLAPDEAVLIAMNDKAASARIAALCDKCGTGRLHAANPPYGAPFGKADFELSALWLLAAGALSSLGLRDCCSKKDAVAIYGMDACGLALARILAICLGKLAPGSLYDATRKGSFLGVEILPEPALAPRDSLLLSSVQSFAMAPRETRSSLTLVKDCSLLSGKALASLSLHESFALAQGFPPGVPMPALETVDSFLDATHSVAEGARLARRGSGSERVLWMDFANVSDKYPFLGAASAASPRTKLMVLDVFKEPKTESCHGVDVVKAPFGILFNGRKVFDSFDGSLAARLRPLVDHQARFLREATIPLDEGCALRDITLAYFESLRAVERFSPSLCLLWNQFMPLSRACQLACHDGGVARLAYLEYGLLPGTLQLDFQGQMGCSRIAASPSEFNALPLLDADRDNAAEALAFLKRTGANRKPQPPYGLLAQKLSANGKPVLFVAGHNDYSSGVFPYGDEARAFHSPFFASSCEFFQTMLALARKKGWFVLYKPHPLCKFGLPAEMEGDSYLIVDKANINECVDISNLVVSVVSQVNYIALIRGKPVALLGRNQMNGAGCAYCVGEPGSIEGVLSDALKHGFVEKLRRNWIDHVARLLKYVLYRYDDSLPAKFVKRSARDFLRDALAGREWRS